MKTIILDIDHCLVLASYTQINELELISKRGYHYLYFRPHLSIFLSYLQKSKYKIIFYTSGKSEYAKWIVNQFNLNYEYLLFTRKYTKRKQSYYGDYFHKSSISLPVKKEKKTYILDDRIDLWEDNGEFFLDISPWHGEIYDNELIRVMLKLLKQKPSLK
jgi:hypothetical protein